MAAMLDEFFTQIPLLIFYPFRYIETLVNLRDVHPLTVMT